MPRLTDDGQTVTLDLHGARINEAVRISQRALALAAQRGRRRVDLIHGTSTSDAHGLNPSIKHALYTWLDGNMGTQQYHHVRRDSGTLSLFLDLTRKVQPARISLRDVWS